MRMTSEGSKGNGGPQRPTRLSAVEDKLSRALETIEAQRRQLSTVFNAVNDAIVVVDERGIIETVNDATCKMFGRPSFELVHHSVNKLMPESVAINHDHYLRSSRPHSKSSFGLPRTLAALHANGRQFPVSITLSEIPRSVDEPRRFVATIRDMTHERAREDQIRFLAFHDDATKLPNRHGILSYLESYFAAPIPPPMLFVHISLNNTSQLTACFGIEEFEQLVVAFSQRLKRVFGTAVLIGRGFGNTFHVVMPIEESESLQAKLVSVVAEPIEIQDIAVVVDVCAGTVSLPDQAADPRQAMHRAAAALMEVKSTTPKPGLPRMHAYMPSIINEMSRRTRLVHNINRAIEDREFSVYLQPKVDITDGSWVGAEALARWTQPDGSMISPGEFIPLAEQAGLVTALNRHMLSQTLRSLADSDWSRTAPLAVNISAQDLSSQNFDEVIARLLEETGVPASALELELTERDMARGSDAIRATIDRIREQGVTIAMDDFGTGYSSLAALVDLPVDILKIDRQFLRRIEDRESDRRLLKTLVTLVQDLGRTIVVEGVETEGQAAFLQQMGVRFAQGFLYARPAPAIAVLNDPSRPRK
ncbi:putative bifunctional diguanylate cyclase/phosphodiesterase [Thalassobaculum salexigens]|uniref:putative bifunctional diguanylate cyclase/phosphodiesterase n=1 Tax=Thalassobaculum salexigens TaxID=455360 RepID=UPI00041E3F33|nr:GGDEF domain-containing phosphodiesterase [Thalassobaculum salexigens]